MRREMSNSPHIREDAIAGLENVVGMLVSVSSRPNVVYGISDLNKGMIRTAVQAASIGGWSTDRAPSCWESQNSV